ncbi:MAG TPA: pentapeptide repeat-containing protein, partial [Allocoleopsis sp.]
MNNQNDLNNYQINNDIPESYNGVGSINPITIKENKARRALSFLIVVAIAVIFTGLILDNFLIGISGIIVTLLLSVPVIWNALRQEFMEVLSPEQRAQLLAAMGMIIAIAVLLKYLALYQVLIAWGSKIPWDAVGTIGEWTGALGQILIAVLAVYIAWRQYIISKDLTIEQNRLTKQQNTLTQQQTIDAYFQGVSDLALDDEGLLEDWPQERAFAEGRTAALLASVDAEGKAKVLRFLSQSKLLTPLKRDRRLGRAILNGEGGYEEDREDGVRVIDLGVMLAGANLSGTDLRWTELSDANLVKADLTNADLVKANLARAILYEADLSGADLKGVRFFYGNVET